MSAIGKKIRDMRKAKGMSQDDLGSVLGITGGEVDAMETSDHLNLDAGIIRKLCETFREYPRAFVYDTEEEFWLRAMRLGSEDERHHISAFLDKPVASEVLSRELGDNGHKVLGTLVGINLTGMNRIVSYVEDLSKIDEFRK